MSAGRQWAKLHVALITDDAFLDLSTAAKCAYLLGIAKAASDLTDGLLPSKVQSIARFSGMTVDEAEAAKRELIAGGFWLDQDGVIAIRTWGKYQTSTEQYIQSRERARLRQQKARGGDVPAAGKEHAGAEDVRKRLWDVLDQSITEGIDGDVAVQIYKRMHDDAVTAGSPGGRYADVKGVGPATLANTVANHAAARWFGTDAQDLASLKRLWSLRRDHGVRLFEEMPRAAAAAKGDPINYLTKLLTKRGAR